MKSRKCTAGAHLFTENEGMNESVCLVPSLSLFLSTGDFIELSVKAISSPSGRHIHVPWCSDPWRLSSSLATNMNLIISNLTVEFPVTVGKNNWSRKISIHWWRMQSICHAIVASTVFVFRVSCRLLVLFKFSALLIKTGKQLSCWSYLLLFLSFF